MSSIFFVWRKGFVSAYLLSSADNANMLSQCWLCWKQKSQMLRRRGNLTTKCVRFCGSRMAKSLFLGKTQSEAPIDWYYIDRKSWGVSKFKKRERRVWPPPTFLLQIFKVETVQSFFTKSAPDQVLIIRWLSMLNVGSYVVFLWLPK